MAENLLAVVIGGVIAIIGGVVGPVVQHFLTHKSREDELRRSNLHALIVAIHELDHWLDLSRRRYMLNNDVDLGPSPLATVEALTRVHFSEAAQQLAALRVATSKHNVWSVERWKERLEGKPLDLSGWQEITENFGIARSNLIAAVTDGDLISHEQIFGQGSLSSPVGAVNASEN